MGTGPMGTSRSSSVSSGAAAGLAAASTSQRGLDAAAREGDLRDAYYAKKRAAFVDGSSGGAISLTNDFDGRIV